MNIRIDVIGVRNSWDTAERKSCCTVTSADPRRRKMPPMMNPVTEDAANASTSTPVMISTFPTSPVTSRMTPSGVVRIVGISAPRIRIT